MHVFIFYNTYFHLYPIKMQIWNTLDQIFPMRMLHPVNSLMFRFYLNHQCLKNFSNKIILLVLFNLLCMLFNDAFQCWDHTENGYFLDIFLLEIFFQDFKKEKLGNVYDTTIIGKISTKKIIFLFQMLKLSCKRMSSNPCTNT